MPRRETKYVPELNLVVPAKGEVFKRIGSNIKKLRRVQKREWKDNRDAR